MDNLVTTGIADWKLFRGRPGEKIPEGMVQWFIVQR